MTIPGPGDADFDAPTTDEPRFDSEPMSQQPPRADRRTEEQYTDNRMQQRSEQPFDSELGRPPELEFEDTLTREMRLALHDFVQAGISCEWCADQCLDESPEMAECVRLCRDVADLAEQNVRFVARDSVFGAEMARVFAEAAEECARECERHPHAHCQECAHTLYRAADSTWAMLDSLHEGTTGNQGRY